MENKVNSYFLVLKDSVIYKAKIASLSSFFTTNSLLSSLATDISVISDTIDSVLSTFSIDHYSKSEMQSLFCTKNDIQNVLNNSSYVTKTDMNSALNELKTTQDVDTFTDDVILACAEIFHTEFGRIKEIIEANKGDHDITEYMGERPTVEDIIDGDQV